MRTLNNCGFRDPKQIVLDVARDPVKASRLYEAAREGYRAHAEMGNAYYQERLGGTYYDGHGVERDYHEAFKWLLKAARQGRPKAQFHVALLLDSDKVGKENPAEAAKWYEKAAVQGHVTAQRNLGVLYYHGDGVEQDLAAMVKWYSMAAEAETQYFLSDKYRHGIGAGKEVAIAFTNLGYMHLKGYGVARNFQRAADANEPRSQYIHGAHVRHWIGSQARS